MSEIWNKEADYSVRSKDEKHKINVEYWEMYGQKGVHIEILDESENVLHFFSVVLDRGKSQFNLRHVLEKEDHENIS